MTEKTPQDIMGERMSQMTRKRAGRLIKPTMSEMIKARSKKLGLSDHTGGRKESAVRKTVAKPGGRQGRTIKNARKEKLMGTASDRTPQKHPFLHARSNK
jgi:hypothetical protein